ncbi:hypothetical protein Dimus_028180 [Dionaea muscipula]
MGRPRWQRGWATDNDEGRSGGAVVLVGVVRVRGWRGGARPAFAVVVIVVVCVAGYSAQVVEEVRLQREVHRDVQAQLKILHPPAQLLK